MTRGLQLGVLATATSSSRNKKIGDCAVTYAAQASCPASCAFKGGGGCYAENGRIFAGVTKPLNETAAALHASPLDVARAEAEAIDALTVVGGRPLRLHTVGDCPDDECARIVSAAAERYMERGGGQVWAYTHAWRDVDRDSWGKVSVLASCETDADLTEAWARGYAGSIVVEEFPGRKRYALDGPGAWKIIPCPAQMTEGAACSSCRLCFDENRLYWAGLVIGFAVHGTASTVKAAVKALRDPDDPGRRLTSRDHALRLLGELGRWPTVRELCVAADVVDASAREMLARLAAESVRPFEVAA